MTVPAGLPISPAKMAKLCAAVAHAVQIAREEAPDDETAFRDALAYELLSQGLKDLGGGADWSVSAWYLGDGRANHEPGGVYLLLDDEAYPHLWQIAQRWYADDYEGCPDELRESCDGGNDLIAVHAEFDDDDLAKWTEGECDVRSNPSPYPLGGNGGGKIQSLIFDGDTFTKAKAKAWAKKRNYRHGDVDEEANTLRLRQRDPEDFDQDSFRTISLTGGVQAVVGIPR